MSVLEECIHGLGPVEACVECNGRAQREAKAAREAPRTFPAKYSGHCPGCNLPIAVGQLIAHLAGAAVTHAECWS